MGMCHDSQTMENEVLKSLPGAEIVLPGIADLEAGRKSVNASAVQCAASRLRGVGLNAPGSAGDTPAAHQLYRQLSSELGDGAHSRYNAILARVASFAGAAELAQRR
ncbi:MAG: hypothetical protein WD827_03045 [Solirubrobacterales bacterium]